MTDVPYGATFRRELAPEWLSFVATINGFDVAPAPPRLRWCELGCGQGITATVVAASHPAAHCVAIDANPVHIDAARALATSAGVGNVEFCALDFAAAFDLACRADWAPFDCIVAHGVYSWVEPIVQAQMRRFIERFLAPGGLVFVSYNTLPGWAADMPFQHLVHALAAGAGGDSGDRFTQAMAAVLGLRDAGAAALRASPTVANWEREHPLRPSGYYPHEYLASAWQPRYVDDVRREFAGIGLVPAGSATICENFDDFVLTQAARTQLAAIPDDDARELARDYFLWQRFRQDVFVRAPKPLSDDERRARLLGFRYALLCPPGEVRFEMATEAGTVGFDNAVARQLVFALGNAPGRPRDLVDASVPDRDVLANILTLCSSGAVQPVVQSDGSYDRLNDALLVQLAAADADFHVLRCGTALRLPGDLLRAARALGGSPRSPAAADPWQEFLVRCG